MVIIKNKNRYIILLIIIFILSLGLSLIFSITLKEHFSTLVPSTPKITKFNNDDFDFDSSFNSFDSLPNYDSNNYDLQYHNEVDFNSLPKNVVLDINNPVIYYKPNTFKYGSQYYVPSYEDTVYLSNLNEKIKQNPSSTSIPLIQPTSTSRPHVTSSPLN
jgi:hypothetical protein